MNFRIESKDSFKIIGYSCANGDSSDWNVFMNKYNKCLRNGGGEKSYYEAPFWQVGAYKFNAPKGENKCIIGAELKDKQVLHGMDIEAVPSATWVVFTFASKTGSKEADEAYTRIITEWFPASNYIRDEKIQSLEVYGPGNANSQEYQWEVWIPVIKKN